MFRSVLVPPVSSNFAPHSIIWMGLRSTPTMNAASLSSIEYAYTCLALVFLDFPSMKDSQFLLYTEHRCSATDLCITA